MLLPLPNVIFVFLWKVLWFNSHCILSKTVFEKAKVWETYAQLLLYSYEKFWNFNTFSCFSGPNFGRVRKNFDEIDRNGFARFAKRNFDEIDRSGFARFAKRNFDEIDRSGFARFAKRNFDEIDRNGFARFAKRNFDEIDNVGFRGFYY